MGSSSSGSSTCCCEYTASFDFSIFVFFGIYLVIFEVLSYSFTCLLVPWGFGNRAHSFVGCMCVVADIPWAEMGPENYKLNNSVSVGFGKRTNQAGVVLGVEVSVGRVASFDVALLYVGMLQL